MTPEQLALFKSLAPAQILALALKEEAGGEPIEGKVAVGCVIRNRTYKGQRFGGWEYGEVILKPKAFSCFNDGTASLQRLITMAQVQVTQWDHNPVLFECFYIAKGIIKNIIRDNTKGADHYYNPALCNPSWAKEMTETAVIGGHRFMKE